MFNSAGLYQQISSQNPAYTIPMPYSYGIPIFEARYSVYPEKEREKRRPSHIFPRKTHQQASAKEKEEPIDRRYFHTQMGYVPVQIVDADKLRHDQGDDREERAREGGCRIERREDVTTLRTWDYSREFAYNSSSNSGQHRDRHMYDHWRSSRLYQASPGESSTPSPSHISNKRFLRKHECVSRVKEYMYPPKKEQTGRDTRSERWGRGHIRLRDQ